jgi:hypothetical protein
MQDAPEEAWGARAQKGGGRLPPPLNLPLPVQLIVKLAAVCNSNDDHARYFAPVPENSMAETDAIAPPGLRQIALFELSLHSSKIIANRPHRGKERASTSPLRQLPSGALLSITAPYLCAIVRVLDMRLT